MFSARISMLLAAAVWTASSIPGFSEDAPTPPAIASFVAVGTGSPKQSECLPAENPAPCVAVPVFIKGIGEDGAEQRLTVDYLVGADLVDKVREDFGATTPVMLRKIQHSLSVGAKAKVPEVKIACKTALPKVAAKVPYTMNSGVKMPLKVETKVAQLAQATRNRIGKKITITSGTRDAARQAEAMRVKISLGENLLHLYANKSAVNEVLHAYRQAKVSGQGKVGVTNAMAQVIEGQVERGVYLSNHLKQGAVDIRSRDLSHRDKTALLQAV
jgi:hypothetical protein